MSLRPSGANREPAGLFHQRTPARREAAHAPSMLKLAKHDWAGAELSAVTDKLSEHLRRITG